MDDNTKPGKFHVSVSDFAGSQIRDLADAVGAQPGRLISQCVEQWVSSPAFGAWLRRATDWREDHPQSSEIDEASDNDES